MAEEYRITFHRVPSRGLAPPFEFYSTAAEYAGAVELLHTERELAEMYADFTQKGSKDHAAFTRYVGEQLQRLVDEDKHALLASLAANSESLVMMQGYNSAILLDIGINIAVAANLLLKTLHLEETRLPPTPMAPDSYQRITEATKRFINRIITSFAKQRGCHGYVKFLDGLNERELLHVV